MRIRRIMVKGLAVIFLMAALTLVGACSRGQSRVDASGVTTRPAVQKSTAEEREEEAKRRAEAEAAGKADAEARSRTGLLDRADQRVKEEIKAFETGPVYFEFDSSDIKAEYRPLLDRKAAWLKAHPEARVRIEGHCDDRGTAEYNLALGEKRAIRVMDYLVSLGVPPKKISTISYGEERPVALDQDEASWAKNRRAEFRVQ